MGNLGLLKFETTSYLFWSVVADGILRDPETYSEAILG